MIEKEVDQIICPVCVNMSLKNLSKIALSVIGQTILFKQIIQTGLDAEISCH